MSTRLLSRCFLNSYQKCLFIRVDKRIGLRWTSTNPNIKGPPGFGRTTWNKLFGKYLLTTNIVSAGVLMAIGDYLSQEIEYQRGLSIERIDFSRLGRMFLVGSLQGPLHHYFYKWMDKIMPVVNMQTTTWKILLDQFIMSPLCIIIFLYPACLLENKTIQQSNDELKAKFPTIYLADWCIWPAAQFINFHYLQPKYRVIYVNLVTMLYNIFLSYIKHKESHFVENIK